MLQNPRKTLGFMKNMVYKIPPGGGGKPYPASGLLGNFCPLGNISQVHIGSISCFFGINDQYNGQSISYKFRQNRLVNS